MKRFAFILLAFWVVSTPASGQISVVPTRLVLDERHASDYFTLRNTTNETLRYRVSLTDLVMEEDGRVVDGTHNGAADDFLRFGPRVVVLPPWEKPVSACSAVLVRLRANCAIMFVLNPYPLRPPKVLRQKRLGPASRSDFRCKRP